MANSCVTVTHDSFKNKTTTSSYLLKFELNGRRSRLGEGADFNIRHISCAPDFDALVIDVHFYSVEYRDAKSYNNVWENIKTIAQTLPGEWAFLRNGQLIIQINGFENIPLEACDAGGDVTRRDITNGSACEEWVYYKINKEILDKICKANSVSMQLSGSDASWTLDGSAMIPMARTFWNGFYDETMYTEEVKQAEAENIVSQKRAKVAKKGCLFEIISVIVGVILFIVLVEAEFSDEATKLDVMAWTLFAFCFVIPFITAIVRRIIAYRIK